MNKEAMTIAMLIKQTGIQHERVLVANLATTTC